MSKSTPKERRQERTREAILTTALEIIKEKGADKLSLREIARRIDYSPAGLYEYYAGKDEIIEAICIEADNRLLEYMTAVDKTLPPLDYIVEIGMAYIDFARRHPEHFIFLFTNQDMEFDKDELKQALDEENFGGTFMIAYHAVQRAVDAGVIKQHDVEPFEMTYIFWSMAHGMAMLEVQHLSHFPVDFKRVDRVGLRAMIEGLAG